MRQGLIGLLYTSLPTPDIVLVALNAQREICMEERLLERWVFRQGEAVLLQKQVTLATKVM